MHSNTDHSPPPVPADGKAVLENMFVRMLELFAETHCRGSDVHSAVYWGNESARFLFLKEVSLGGSRNNFHVFSYNRFLRVETQAGKIMSIVLEAPTKAAVNEVSKVLGSIQPQMARPLTPPLSPRTHH